MRRSTDRIITTHAGSLSRPSDLIALNRARAAEETWDDGAYQKCLSSAVADVIRKQQELGVDIPDDGEFGKPMAANYDYGVWWNYAFARMEGFVPADSVAESAHKKSSVADVALTTIRNRRDWQKFSEFYQDPESSGTLVGSAARRPTRRPVCTAPIKYVGHAAIRADIENLKSNGFFGYRRRLHVLDRARKLRPRRGSLLQNGRGVRLRCRRNNARGI
jgi:5-methyltetrahydropteroyltriglutamate--homocysteine methyltransferase